MKHKSLLHLLTSLLILASSSTTTATDTTTSRKKPKSKPKTKAIPVSKDVSFQVPVDLSFFREELVNGSACACPRVILIFARGTFEPGNIGIITGPTLERKLKEKYGPDDVWTQGVGGDYDASIAGIIGQVLSGPNPSSAVNEGIRMFELAHSKCPGSKIVAGGYSQGAALIGSALGHLPRPTKRQVRAVVLFGYPGGNNLFHGKIPHFPDSRVANYCAEGDVVCDLVPFIRLEHLSYFKQAGKEAPEFLEDKIGPL